MEEYTTYLNRAYQKKWLTNRGELTLELEERLKHFLKVENVLVTNNGTVPLQLALRLLEPGGEIITTPFSYVATSAAILWERFTPVYVDIDPIHLTIDESLIEAAITPKTRAILATHVYGNPCAVEIIEEIAGKYGLKVIYDAAHCFGVEYKGKSIFEFGDVSTCSFHATKIFHTGEGGALFCKDPKLRHQLYYMHNFGHDGPLDFHGLGINAKISELQTAMGLAVLDHIDEIFDGRKAVVDAYDALLDFNHLTRLQVREGTQWNYHYYPVIFRSEQQLLKVQEHLQEHKIYPRRYFYPSLNTIRYINGNRMPISEDIAGRTLCLPLFVGLPHQTIEVIADTINGCVRKSTVYLQTAAL